MRKLILEDFDEAIDYAIIGMHCNIEDYRLAYLLNQYLGLNLKRKAIDLVFNDTSSFPIYEWEDSKQLTIWNLVSNKSKITITPLNKKDSLFNNEATFLKNKALIPEFKTVNFLLKIGNNPTEATEKKVIQKIIEIPQIVTAYSINPKNLKKTKHLIFN